MLTTTLLCLLVLPVIYGLALQLKERQRKPSEAEVSLTSVTAPKLLRSLRPTARVPAQKSSTILAMLTSRAGVLHRHAGETRLVIKASVRLLMREKSPKVLSWVMATALLHAGLVVPLQSAVASPWISMSFLAAATASTEQSGVVPGLPNCHQDASDLNCVNPEHCLQGSCGFGHCSATSLILTLHAADFPPTRSWLRAFVTFGKGRASSPEPKPPRQLHCA
jgi:hypothetical protein